MRARARALVFTALLWLSSGMVPTDAAEAQDVVRDRQGNVAAAVTPGKEGSRTLVLFDRDGTVRAIVDLGVDGSPTLSLIGKDGTTRLRLLPDGSLRLVPGDGQLVASPEAPSGPSPTPGGRGTGAVTDSRLIPWVLALGGTLFVVLVALIVLELRSARWTRTFEDFGRTFTEDRQRERDSYLRFVVAQTEQSGEQRTLEQAEAMTAELIKALEHARAEIAAMAERLQGRGSRPE